MRKEFKVNGKTILSNLCKLILNSLYGKFVSWDVEDKYIVTTFKNLQKRYADDNLIDFDEFNNG